MHDVPGGCKGAEGQDPEVAKIVDGLLPRFLVVLRCNHVQALAAEAHEFGLQVAEVFPGPLDLHANEYVPVKGGECYAYEY